MTTFLIFASLLCLLTLAPLLYVLLKPVRPGAAIDANHAGKTQALAQARAAGVLTQDEYDQKLAALKAEAPATAVVASPPPARKSALFLLLIAPLALFVLYRQFGQPQALDPANLIAQAGENAPTLEAAISSLEEKLKADPDDAEGWRLLARGYQSMQNFQGALDALTKARELAPDQLDLQVEYAEALALNTPTRRIDGEALRLLEDAISRDERQERALWLLGIAAVQTGDQAKAIDYWQRLRTLLPPESEIAKAVDQQLAQLGATPVASAPATDTPSDPAKASESPVGDGIQVQVTLADALRAKVGPNAVLYVFARPAEGPRMPLAIQRLPASQLPLAVRLDDSMGMMPTMKLSQTERIIVGARISQSGEANPQAGDLEGLSEILIQADIKSPIAIEIGKVL